MSGHADVLLAAAREAPERDAIIWRDRSYSYGWLLEAVAAAGTKLHEQAIGSGSVVAIEGDFSPEVVATLLAAIDRGCIVVPLTSAVAAQREEFLEIAQVGRQADHPLYRQLRALAHPGLVLFSSGSTGKSKAAVHDFVPLLEKFAVRRKARRMLAFLLFDHIGGVNTLLYVLSNGGTLITTRNRSPHAVCTAIEEHRVQVLPTTPTFLHLLLLSEEYKAHDLSSLELITYGTEVMPEPTLRRVHETFPGVDLQQTYGLSELGILRSKSKAPDSLWVKIGGEGFETRVRDGLLEIRARSAMLGYLNAPSPFTDDGWFRTGDSVAIEGEYMRIFGRSSEIINVGGEKVYPAEVEAVLESIEGVEEASVAGEPNVLTGQMVVARVRLGSDLPLDVFRVRMRAFCRGKLAPYKIPQKVLLADRPMHGERFKKLRR